MRPPALFLLAVLVLGLGAFWWLRDDAVDDDLAPVRGPDGAVAGETMDLDAPVDSDAGLPLLTGEADASPPASEATAAATEPGPRPPGTARLSVRVVRRADGAPVPGARVRVLPGRPGPDDPAHWPALADDDGVARLDLPAPFAVAAVLVAPGRDHGGAHDRNVRRLTARDDLLLVLEVDAPSSLAGQVVDEHDQPVSDAMVQAWSLERWLLPEHGRLPPDVQQLVGPDGRFDFASVGPHVVLSAEAADRVVARRLSAELEPGSRTEDVRLVMARGLPFEVLVQRADGAPVPDVEVRARRRQALGPQTATQHPHVWTLDPASSTRVTDAAGLAVFEALAPGTLTVDVDAPGHPRFSAEHDVAEGRVVVTLETGSALTGIVRGADGSGLPGASVRLSVGGGGTAGTRREATTDASGRFELSGIPAAESGRLVAFGPGHAVHVESDVASPDGSPRHVEIDLEPGLALSGTLLDADGDPLGGAPLAIEGQRLVPLGFTMVPKPTWEFWAGLSTTVTDEAGRFRFEHLYAGGFTLTARLPDAPSRVTRWELRAGDEDLQLVFGQGDLSDVLVRGRVTDARTARPVESFVVTAMRATGTGGFVGFPRTFEHSPDGRYELTELDVGEWRFTVKADGYARAELATRTLGEGIHELDAQLVPARELALLVVDSAGLPLEGIPLDFETVDGERLSVVYGPGAMTTQLLTDAEGRVRARGLPATQVVVKALPPGRPRGLEDAFPFDLWDPLEGEQTLVLADSVSPERAMDVRLSFFSSKTPEFERPALPERIESEADREAILPHHQSGLLHALSGRATIAVRAADGGNDGRNLTLTPSDNGYVLEDSGVETAQSHGFARLLLRRDTDWNVEVFAQGHNSYRMTIPAESDGAEFLLVLWEH